MAKMEVLHLTPTEHGELHIYLRKYNVPAGVAQRVRIVPLLCEGIGYREITDRIGGARFDDFSLEAKLRKRQACRALARFIRASAARTHAASPHLRAKVLERTRQAPPDDSAIKRLPAGRSAHPGNDKEQNNLAS